MRTRSHSSTWWKRSVSARLMSGAERSVVAALGPEQVDAIRKATLEMLDRAENKMPLDCNVDQSVIDGGAPVT